MRVISNSENEMVIFDDEEVKQASAYWTEARMLDAKPTMVNLPALPGFTSSLSESGEISRADVSQYPFNQGGKLFVRRGDRDSVASGQFCGDPALMLTAAHCVCDGSSGQYYEDLVFCKAYANGAYKIYPIRAVCIKKAWYPNTQYQYDYSFIITQFPNTEYLNYKLQIPGEEITAIGYPLDYESGKYMQKVDGKKGGIDKGIVQMLSNPMEGGASGGAWLQNNTVVGLNSFLRENHKNEVFGPYLDESFESLFQFAKTNK